MKHNTLSGVWNFLTLPDGNKEELSLFFQEATIFLPTYLSTFKIHRFHSRYINCLRGLIVYAPHNVLITRFPEIKRNKNETNTNI